MKLLSGTERMVFPFDGDPKRPESAAVSGNFHICMLPNAEALVTDASLKPYYEKNEGVTMISRVVVADS